MTLNYLCIATAFTDLAFTNMDRWPVLCCHLFDLPSHLTIISGEGSYSFLSPKTQEI
jgi:hypothetical protein